MRIQLTKDSDFLRDDRFDTKVDKSIRRGYVYKGLLLSISILDTSKFSFLSQTNFNIL